MSPFNLGDGPTSEARKKKKGNESLDTEKRQSASKYQVVAKRQPTIYD